MKRRSRQLGFTFRTHGGARRRRVDGARRSVPHRARPALDGRHPVHVTLRVGRQVGWLRREAPFGVLRGALTAAKDRLGMRIIHFSVQRDHIHLLVEAGDRRALTRGMRGLTIRIARQLNGAIGRKGRVFADRYHARALGTPREVRNALVYVINNDLKHREARERGQRFDGFSSGAWFDGWREGTPIARAGPVPVSEARTWLLQRGWRRAGAPPGFREAPAAPKHVTA